ncbi:MAG: type B DNA-directed DNA polymerase [Candidatus Nanohalobium sp.]
MFKVDFINGDAVKWHKDGDGSVRAEKDKNYRPRFYLEGDRTKLQRSRPWLTGHDGVVATCFETWRPTLSKPEKKVLRIDCTSEERLKKVVSNLKKKFDRTAFRFYNVGFSPQFRYCLQNEICPTPDNRLDRMEIGLHRKHLSNGKVQHLRIDGKNIQGGRKQVLKALKRELEERDPDVLRVNRGETLRLVNEEIDKLGLGFSLGRLNRFEQLAGENTVSSYGKTVHSAARYNVPGRIVIDESNSFLLDDATLEGLWDLVERSYRPMQELAWGSIGRVLTSIEVRRAYLEEDTLTPWKNWEGEKPKKASTLHKADRGGFIFNPEPGVHFDVLEADFASLFPNIMVKKNISPETVNCSCCDNNKVPELDYTICQESRGFISKVLKPLVEDRQDMKEIVDDIEDEEERKHVQGSIDAIKWLLVSCFGYMGHSHASYGAIKCHQAIQAYDRDIMVKTKELFEESGYEIAHGIIDSIWVQKKNSEESKAFEKICREVSQEIDIELEPEHRFEWCAFIPRTGSEAKIGTLNRYFGKKKNGEFKTAGIEVEQDSSCQFIKDSQIEMIKALDKDMNPEDVIEVLEERIEKLKEYEADAEDLVIEKKASKHLEEYQVENRTVAALKRSHRHGIDVRPGQSVRYVVRNDDGLPYDRVRLGFEAEERDYDADFYRTQLIRACESVLSPLGWDEERIRQSLNPSKKAKITDF